MAQLFRAWSLPHHAAFVVEGGRPSKAEVATFAEHVGIAPSIVVGRLQRDGVIPHNWMQDLKTRLDWAE